MKHLFTTRLLACLAMLLLLWPGKASASPFTPGNLVVVRIGDGTTVTASGASAATFLLEYTPAGVLVQTIALPTAAAGTNSALTNTASSSSEGLMTRAANGAYLVLTGYDAPVGTTGLTNTASTATNRIIGRIAADGTFDTSTRLSDAFSGTSTSAANIRSAATVDGTSFYAVGSNTGVRYVPFGNAAATATTAISTAAPTNIRGVNIFGGNLYVSSASGAFQGISQVGTGLPTTGPQTIVALPGFPVATGPSPYGFFAADLSTTVPGIDVLYIADDRTATDGGIQKWSLVGGTWISNGSMAASPAVAIRSVDGMVSGTTVSLVASGNGGIYLVADNAGYNAAPTTTTLPTPVVPAPGTNAVFRGIAFAPVALAAAPTITSFTPTSGAAGATVTITGTNLTGATAVTLNGVAITGFTVVNGTTITFTVPATGATSGTIAVTTPSGTATSTGTFTVTPAAVTPVISTLTPGVQVAGGAAVTLVITGTGFTPTSTVNFNGVSYPQTTSTATSIEALIPASALTTPGSYPVTVTNTAGTSNAFNFTVNNPTTAGVFEDFETGTKTGYAAASVVLTSGSWTFSDALLGNAFNDRANGLKAARIRVGFIRMDFDKPTGAGTVIVNAAMFGTDTGATFILEKSTDGGTTFTTVPGAPATLTSTLTPYTFTVNQAGNVRFRITSTATATTSRINIDDISISNFTAPAAPTITSFTPTTGGPGTTVTVTGTNFTGATAVRIGAFTVTNFTVVNGTTITFVVPGGTGSVSGLISVVTPGGTATSATAFNLVSAVLASQALPGLSVFPNPATDRIMVELPTTGAATVALRDLTGRLVLAPAALGADKQVLLPAALAKGLYLLEVRQGDVTAVRRIEKN